MNNDMKEITLNEMEQVNGGYIFKVECGFDGWDEICYFEVIDDKTGNVIDDFDRLDDAREFARVIGQSDRFINWPALNKLRIEAGIYPPADSRP